MSHPFKQGGCYKHINGKDLFIEVLEILEEDTEWVEVKTAWWNEGGFSKPRAIHFEITHIKSKDWEFWLPHRSPWDD